MAAQLSNTLLLAQKLIQQKSVTPEDAACQEILMCHLQPIGFSSETMQFDEVTNLWARKGTDGPVLAFAGHTVKRMDAPTV